MKTRALIASLIVSASFICSAAEPPPADVVPYAGLSPQDACDKATLPPGFKMHAFAAEPDLVQPIAFCLDPRGRVWVAEGNTYPVRRGNPPPDSRPAGADRSQPTPGQLKDIFGGADRILVFEDTNGDHKFDKRTVFLENVNLVSGLEVGFGGVWIGAAPYLMFVPVTDWDNPKPAGDPRILLDGWDYKADTHETLNTFLWGPDGWLYGAHGVFCPSHVGKPGASDSERQWIDAGVWRYHPTRHVFEVFAEGGSNPWGVDFDEYGQCWMEMCVIPHLNHMVQGGRFQRQGGEHFTIHADETQRYARPGVRKTVHPHIYDDIKTVADHVHWAGTGGPHAANARSDSAGGGHAHAGLMVYLGESWPEKYRGHIFMGNISGQRLNVDIPERRGSGFVGKHGPDFLNFNDSWSQTLNQLYDQDGSVYIIDWYDANQCHHTREDGHDRSNGRIYKVVYNNQKVSRIDLAKLSNAELVKLVTSRNEFKSRHARRILQERAQNGAIPELAPLKEILRSANATSPQRLRALWTLHVTTGLDARTVLENLRSPDEYVRAWTIQLAFESRENLARLVREARDQELRADPSIYQLAESDPSPVVRLYLAAAAQRAPEEVRARLVRALLQRSEDAGDHNIPLMLWFAMDPLAADYPEETLTAAFETKLPRILNFTTRRVAAIGTTQARDLVVQKIGSANDAAKQLDMLHGLAAALRGQRSVTMPAGWKAIETRLGNSSNAELRTIVQTLSLTFGSQEALAALRGTLTDKTATVAARRSALDSLVSVRDPELPPVLQKLLTDRDLRGPALRALGGYNDPKTPDALLGAYTTFEPAHKRDALNTLASRPAFAKPLLDAVAANKLPSQDLSADIVRQLRNHKDPEIQQHVATLYGAVRESSADAKAEIERYRRIYRAGGSQPGDASKGRAVYNKVCAQCHILFDYGGTVGPDITGAARFDLNYLLENIIDPNAVIPNDYRTTEIETTDDRSIVGILKKQDDNSVTIQTANEVLVIPRNEIESIRQTELSMMPEGLLATLTDQEVRDLIYYLTRVGQVPLPVESAAK
jgi:putative membrane-bound dehydrogenase-like protein